VDEAFNPISTIQK